jgi:hypothetical protein
MIRRSVPILLAVLLALGLAACGGEGDTETETESTTVERTITEADNESFGENDVEAARTTLEGVINRAIRDPGYTGGGFRDDPAVSADLIAQLNALEEANREQGFPGFDVNPFICAQNTPSGVTFNEAGTAADRITFVGRYRFGKTTEKVTYVLFGEPNGQWQLDSTECVDAAQPKGE